MPVTGIVYRADKGAPLTITEFDQNFRALSDFLDDLESDGGFTGRGIALIAIDGDALTFTMTDGSDEGPFTVPTLKLNPVGEWEEGDYAVLDAVTAPSDSANAGAGYVCVIAHSSGASFDADVTAGRWVKLVDRGLQGLTGSRGQTGYPGETGPRGLTGLQGQTGPLGLTGQQGQTGPTGMPGDPGPQGLTGAPYTIRVNTFSPSAGAVTVDWSSTDVAKVTLTDASTTLTFTGSPADGKSAELILIQGSGGNKLVTQPSDVAYSADIPGAPTLSTTAGKRDRIGYRYDSDLSKWALVAFNRGF